MLGAYWARHGVRIDAVYTGPRKRQLDTALIAGAEYSKGCFAWP
jgi:broad specificity phosphatase PhoE